MRILIAEDDRISRDFLQNLLSQYGECDAVADGLEAINNFFTALKSNRPYGLVSLDIMMPKLNGVKVLRTIRDLETRKGILPCKRSKVIITTALIGSDFVQDAFETGCEGLVEKPVNIGKFVNLIHELGFIEQQNFTPANFK